MLAVLAVAPAVRPKVQIKWAILNEPVEKAISARLRRCQHTRLCRVRALQCERNEWKNVIIY